MASAPSIIFRILVFRHRAARREIFVPPPRVLLAVLKAAHPAAFPHGN